jgi:hypothetical protein
MVIGRGRQPDPSFKSPYSSSLHFNQSALLPMVEGPPSFALRSRFPVTLRSALTWPNATDLGMT